MEKRLESRLKEKILMNTASEGVGTAVEASAAAAQHRIIFRSISSLTKNAYLLSFDFGVTGPIGV